MEQGQNQFYDFIMDKVDDENKDAAKKLLNDSFSKQSDGSFTREYLLQTQQEILKLIRSESSDEVQAAMYHYASLIE